jgi:hypothetical protein
MMLARYVLHVDGKSIVKIAIGGFAFAVLSMTVVNAFLSQFHRFM